MSISDCQTLALNNNDIYVGMQNGGNCFTGSSDPTKLGSAPSTTRYNGAASINQVWKYTDEP